MPPYRRQHWVAQSYLRRFSPDPEAGRTVHAFDKRLGTARECGVADVAQATYFYEKFLRDPRIPPAERTPHGLFESEFRKWEDALGVTTAVAERVAAGGGGTLEERQTAAICVAVQMLRTPAYREGLVDEVTAGLQADFLAHLRETQPDLAAGFEERWRMQLTDPWLPSAMHVWALWRSGIVPELATALCCYVWVVASNETPAPFYTSDLPVVWDVHGVPLADLPAVLAPDGFSPPLEWLLQLDRPYGVELAFPLTPRLALLLYHPGYFTALPAAHRAHHPDYFAELGTRNGRHLSLGTASVERLNALQAVRCDRHVYSCTPDFSTARRALKRAA